MIPSIPDGFEMTAGFMVGLIIGTAFGLLVRHVIAVDELELEGRASFLRGRNHERRAHGEDELVPAPRLNDTEALEQYGIGS